MASVVTRLPSFHPRGGRGWRAAAGAPGRYRLLHGHDAAPVARPRIRCSSGRTMPAGSTGAWIPTASPPRSPMPTWRCSPAAIMSRPGGCWARTRRPSMASPGIRFAVWAPNAERVSVVGPFCDWDGRRLPMRVLGSSGVWELFVPGLAVGDLYKYEIRSRVTGGVETQDRSLRRSRWRRVRPPPPSPSSDAGYPWQRWRLDAGPHAARLAACAHVDLRGARWAPGSVMPTAAS